jgi:hypothetical protein
MVGPAFGGNTMVWMFRSWSSVLERRRVASLKEFISCQKVLHLEMQFSRLGKEEVVC